MPASVTVVIHAPPGRATVQAIVEAASAGCQSQFCPSSTRPSRATAASVHSPAPVRPASSSVRALTAKSSSTGTPAPAAMPSISATRSGRARSSRSPTAAPCVGSAPGSMPALSCSSLR